MSHQGLPTETFAFLSGVSSSFRADKKAAFLLALRLTPLDNVQSRKGSDAPYPAEQRPLLSPSHLSPHLPISPQPNTHPLESAEIRQGVL